MTTKYWKSGWTSGDPRNPCLKLTEIEVFAIRHLSAQGIAYPKLAAMFQVNKNTIGRIVRREAWKHLT